MQAVLFPCACAEIELSFTCTNQVLVLFFMFFLIELKLKRLAKRYPSFSAKTSSYIYQTQFGGLALFETKLTLHNDLFLGSGHLPEI